MLALGFTGCSESDQGPPNSGTPTATTAGTETSTGTTTTATTPSGPTAGVDACPAGSFDACGEPEEISGEVTEDRTLGGRDCAVCRVTDWLNVRDGATLTIEPGTKLTFAQGAGLYIEGPGSLSAVGTCDAPILMTGDQPLPGTWNGIWFENSNRAENELGYCIVEYGGSPDQGANLLLRKQTRVEIHDCTFSHAEQANLWVVDYPTIPEFSRNVLTKSEGIVAHVWPTSLQYLSGSSTYSGNAKDYIEVPSHNVDSDFEGTWDGLDVPYRIRPNSTSSVLWMDGDLTIENGATIEAEQDVGITISGSLSADGISNDQPDEILFTGVEKTPGYWRGLAFENTKSERNQLRYVTIEYAGGYPARFAAAAANLSAIRESKIVTDTVTLRKGAKHGLYLGPGVDVQLNGNQIEGNQGAPAWVTADTAHQFNATNRNVTDNDIGAVLVRGGSGSGYGGSVTGDVTWEALDVPYRIVPTNVDGLMGVTGHLTIQPSTTIEFSEGCDIRTSATGALTADGSDGEPITFTGTEETKGHWGGVFFVDTGGPDNLLRNCVIEYAGAYEAPFARGRAAGAGVSRGEGNATIENCTIRSIPGVGLYRERISRWTISGNTFEDVDGQETVVVQTP